MTDRKTTAKGDWLDDLLRERPDYVPDEGFTARTLSRLPARRRWYASRNFVILAATAIACTSAFLMPGLAQEMAGSLIELSTLKALNSVAAAVSVALLYGLGLAATTADR